METNPAVIFRGDTVTGHCALKQVDSQNPNYVTPFAIPGGAVIEVIFPGPSGVSVVLSTANSGEITVLNPANGYFSYLMSTAKSALLVTGQALAIDVVVSTASPVTQTTFEKCKILDIRDRANP